MQSAIAESELQVGQGHENDLAVPTLQPLPIGAAIASNPPGVRASCFKVLGNDQLGFQVWVSRDGLTWLPFGQTYATYREMATAFAGSYPRPAEILDPIIAAAYDAPESASFLAPPADQPEISGTSVRR